MVDVHDNMSIDKRVETIMRAEPQERKKRFWEDNSSFADTCNAAHGTNLAAVLSALRNTSGQLVPINQLGDNLWASGATPEPILGGGPKNPLRSVVFATDILRFGSQAFATAERYARCEAGMEPKLEGSRTVRRSEAALIPALLLGELVDPNGNGAKLNSQFQNPTQAVVDSIPADNPLYGKTLEEVKAVFSDQIIGERFKILGIFVAHPTKEEENTCVLELAEKLVQASGLEQGCDYSGIRVGLLRRDIVKFKQQIEGRTELDDEDIHQGLLKL